MEQKKLEEAKKLLTSLNRAYDNELINATIECIDKALSQPEIIHCGECKHRNKYYDDFVCGLQYDEIIVKDDDFCSWAERKDGKDGSDERNKKET